MAIPKRGIIFFVLFLLLSFSSLILSQHAFAQQTQQEEGSIGLEGTIPAPPPKIGATITVPTNGQTFNQIPITVQGLCPNDLLVKIFKNNIFAGATICKNGSYSLQIDLFSGKNELVARVFDDLDQAGPDSNKVTVTYNDADFAVFGPGMSLTSDYARRGVSPNVELTWPIILSGGQGPYAISVDWGDGNPTELISLTGPGAFTIKHTYKSPGIYNILVKGTDRNGSTAYLQLVGVVSGPVAQTASSSQSDKIVIVRVLWWPAAVAIPLIITTFWLGKRHELYVLRKKIEKQEQKTKK